MRGNIAWAVEPAASSASDNTAANSFSDPVGSGRVGSSAMGTASDIERLISKGYLGRRSAAPADENIEIDAMIGLLHMVKKEFAVTALISGRRSSPCRPPPVEFSLGDVEVESPPRHVERNEIAALHQCQ